MAQWKKEQVAELLEAKMQATVSRLKNNGHKAGIGNLADDLAPFVIALMSDSRRREVGRTMKLLELEEPKGAERLLSNALNHKLRSRYQELKVMAQVLWRFADAEMERKKPNWQR